ncbi:hypothetical protein BDW02DRAFT_283266 [Decorospora gaudefroyi]|uniref:Uncharacterized protein n=1 Tax=Decorospora gaudefroyi TaxID=184978 RepID=A0A6A5KJ00_9PLEO|nr:hypothetical protein BDW02DRAFT_283266 [Decorospora gaudefroyi]
MLSAVWFARSKASSVHLQLPPDADQPPRRSPAAEPISGAGRVRNAQVVDGEAPRTGAGAAVQCEGVRGRDSIPTGCSGMGEQVQARGKSLESSPWTCAEQDDQCHSARLFLSESICWGEGGGWRVECGLAYHSGNQQTPLCLGPRPALLRRAVAPRASQTRRCARRRISPITLHSP